MSIGIPSFRKKVPPMGIWFIASYSRKGGTGLFVVAAIVVITTALGEFNGLSTL